MREHTVPTPWHHVSDAACLAVTAGTSRWARAERGCGCLTCGLTCVLPGPPWDTLSRAVPDGLGAPARGEGHTSLSGPCLGERAC